MHRPLAPSSATPRSTRASPRAAAPQRTAAARLDSAAVDRLQRADLRTEAEFQAPADGDLLGLIACNHGCNRLLWIEEAQSRQPQVVDAVLAQHKRTIDRLNRQRYDAIEAIDACLLAATQHIPTQADAWLNSESAGSIIDRLSVNLLKLHELGLQTERVDAAWMPQARCQARLEALRDQRSDLLGCLQRLLDGLRDGSCCFRLHRLCRMDDDPALAGCLDGAGRH